jgi:hypothetical protein
MSGSTLPLANSNAEMQSVELLKLLPSSAEAEIATEVFKKYRLIDRPIDQILAELIQAESNTLHSEIHKC